VVTASADALLENIAAWDVLVLIHPNNPGGERFDPARLLQMHGELAARGGWLVIDEAFMDVTPAASVCRYTDREGLVVLRSVGKFFGLAGARAGFVCAAPALLEMLQEQLGPWTLSGPTRHALRHALADRTWQVQARARLLETSERLRALLAQHGCAPAAGCGLFQWCTHADAARIHHALAARGILTRLFDAPASLRFGLPPDEIAFARLDQALAEVLP
jgi:histidinol-phosphate/aromatic aminotransferase/cobyric acid decarboxylase-like protein